MGFDAQNTPKKQKPIPPAGLNLAVCYSIIDLGTQQEQFPGQAPTWAKKVHFSWEFPNLPHVVFDPQKGAQIQATFNEYSIVISDRAKLPKVLCSWGNIKKEDLKTINSQLMKAYLGAPCMLNMTHTASKKDFDADTNQPIIYANIGGNGLMVMPKMAEIPKPAGTVNPIKFLDLDFFDWAVYNSLPKFLQDKISKSKEWPGILVKWPKPAETAQPQYQAAATNIAAPAVQQNQLPVEGPGVVTQTSGPTF